MSRRPFHPESKQRSRTTHSNIIPPSHSKPSEHPKPSDLIDYIDTKIQESFAMAGVELEDPSDTENYMIRCDTVRHQAKELEQAMEWLRKNYTTEMQGYRDLFQSKKWIQDDTKLKRKIRETPIGDLLNLLWASKLNIRESLGIARSIGAGMYETMSRPKKGEPTKKRSWAYVFLPSPNYTVLENELNISQRSIQRYLDTLSEIGVLRRFRKQGANQSYTYAMGYYMSYKDPKTEIKKNRPRPFFSKKHKEQLKALRVHR